MKKKKKIVVAAVVTMSVFALTLCSFLGFRNIQCKAAQVKAQQIKVINKKASFAKVQKQKMVKKTSSTSDAATATTSKKVAYLTFDDGPSKITPRLLRELKQYNVKATFFVVANRKNTPKRRAWMKEEVAAGNTIGIHSWTHDYSYIYASESNFLTDLGKIKSMVTQATGVKPKFMRLPGGTDNTVSFKYHNNTPIMPTLLKDIEEKGITAVDWNAGGMDAVYPVPKKSTIVNGVVDECKYLKKAIILLHDSSPHSSSVAAVPQIITRLRAMGFTFEPLTSSSQAFHHKPAKRR